MKRNSKTQFAVFLLTTLSLLTSAYAQITPLGDAYTNTADPTTNYGAKTLLDVDGATQITYIQFNLSSIPTGASVSQATLKLYVNSVTTAGSLNVDYVNGTWSEGKIDAGNAPPLGSTFASNVAITTADKNQYMLINVTPAVQAWLNGSQANDGIALVANGSFNATFDSKENTTTSHPAGLDIVFAGDGTITGITTASGSGLTGGGTSGTLNLSLLTNCTSGQTLGWNGSAWACKTVSGTGTVTSVGLSAPSSDFTVSGSPVTTSGTLGLNWNVAPTNGATANAIVKRDSAGGFGAGDISVGNITAGGAATIAGALSVGANAYLGGFVGVGVHVAQATLNVNEGGVANSDTFLVGNNSTKGVQLRDTGAGVDLESFGVPLYVNAATSQSTFLFNSVGIGTTAPQAELNLNYAGNANADTLLVGNNTSKGVQLRDTGLAADLESFGVPLYVNNLTQQNLYLNPSGGNVVVGGTEATQYPLTVVANANGFSALFDGGQVYVYGNLYVNGPKSFRIDHPLDPTNKYLDHAAIESSEVLNQYSGNVVLDGKGEARVEFPAWFAAINEDFRYQLTAIGAPGPNLYVAEEITDNSFAIAGGKPGMKVSWQVTARRNDAYMKAHPYVVEQDKPEWERGYYSDPALYGAPKEQGIRWAHEHAPKER